MSAVKIASVNTGNGHTTWPIPSVAYLPTVPILTELSRF